MTQLQEPPSSSSTTSSEGRKYSETWTKSIDAVYALFEEDANRLAYPRLAEKVEKAVALCQEVIEELGPKRWALSFNGGKDCTVLVHILSAVLRRIEKLPARTLAPIPALYITCTSPFAEVDEFVAQSMLRYDLRIVKLGGDMKEGLEAYLDGVEEVGDSQGHTSGAKLTSEGANSREERRKRDCRAIFLGTRRTDPHGADLTPRAPTDKGWPDVERVQPILDWDYADVWAFLRCPLLADSSAESQIPNGKQQKESQSEATGLARGSAEGVPYCILYDQGYTSLGSTFNTFPNPYLRSEEEHHYKPAYMLKDGSLERCGRGKQPPPPEKS